MDAFAQGVRDAKTGLVIQKELIKSIFEMKKGGWSNKRTIVFPIWPASLLGLIGTVEYHQEYRATVEQMAMAYLSLDQAVVGTDICLSRGSPLFNTIATFVAEEIDWQDCPISSGKGKEFSLKTLYLHHLTYSFTHKLLKRAVNNELRIKIARFCKIGKNDTSGWIDRRSRNSSLSISTETLNHSSNRPVFQHLRFIASTKDGIRTIRIFILPRLRIKIQSITSSSSIKTSTF